MAYGSLIIILGKAGKCLTTVPSSGCYNYQHTMLQYEAD